MGLFRKQIDIKNASKTTYSEDDLNKLLMGFRKEFEVQGEKRIYSPFRRETPRAWDTRMRDMAYEKILDDRLFTFKHLLVIPNPYGISVQTALLLFNTSQECRVRYRILGKTPENDFVGETEPATRHRVPILGLYKGFTNKLKLELLDEEDKVFRRRDLTIYARDIPLRLQNIVTKVEREQPSVFPFIMVNGVHFNPIAIDHNGEVRYSIQMKTNTMGMLPLDNGHFLYADASQNRVDENGTPVPCQYHEMDYMGRIYRSYLIEHPLSSVAAQREDSLFLVTASKAKYMGDCILEIDRESGQEKKRLNLVDVLGSKYQNQRTWAPVTALEWCGDHLLVAIKRFHMILALNWETSQIVWALTPKSIWTGTEVEQYVLEGEDGKESDGYVLEHMTSEQKEDGTIRIRAYYEQNRGTVPVEGSEASEDSRILFFEIGREGKTFRVQRKIDVVKAKRFGSSFYDETSGRVLSLAGCLERQSENLKACVEELDQDSGDVINRMRLCKVYRQAWLFEPDIPSYSMSLQKKADVVHGYLSPPAAYDGEVPVPCEEKLKKKIFGNIRICGNLFLYAFYPSTVQRVYLVGREHCYMQDYSELKLKRKRMSFSIALDSLACDEYQVYVEYDGKVYQLKNEIRIE